MAGHPDDGHACRHVQLPDAGCKALRKGRISRPAQVYLISTTTSRWRPLFTTTHAARTACRIIASRGSWGDAALLAWVLMPDHWHGLVQLGDVPLGKVINRFKAGITRSLRNERIADGPIWDRGYHDHALRVDEDVKWAARYLVANPLRAGLADHVMGYPYWNAIWL